MILLHMLLGFGLGIIAAKGFEWLPAKWFCDYGESPQEQHLKQNRHLKPKNVLLFAVICACVCTAFNYFSLNADLIVSFSFCVTAAVLFLIALSDIKYSIIPNELLLTALVCSIPLAFRSGYVQPLAGFLVGGAMLFAIFFIAAKVLKKEAMGFGDVLLSALCGFICGAKGFIIVIFTAVLSAAIVFAVLIIAKKIDKDAPQPFGPFLITGAIICICFWPFWQILLQAYFYL